MNWSIEPVAVADVKRAKQQPSYGFVEQAVGGGTAYVVAGGGSAGYFIVAPESSLVPGFVVELSLPELAVPDRYAVLASGMAERSLGVLWFDSQDRDACDFAWRLGLTLRSGPPLFCWEGLPHDVELDGFEVRIADGSDEAAVTELLTSAPPHAGGQTREAAVQNLEGGCISVLTKDGDILGAAVLSPLPGPYVALTGVVMKTFSDLGPEQHERAHRDLELVFMNQVAARLAEKNLKTVYSMAPDTPTGYLEAIRLNMALVKQSFMANFGTVWRSP